MVVKGHCIVIATVQRKPKHTAQSDNIERMP